MIARIKSSIHTRDGQTWLCLLSGAVLWFVHMNVVYPITSVACKWGWFPFTVWRISGLQFIEIVISLILAVLLAITIYIPWRNWRYFRANSDATLHETARDRRPLMAFVTMVTNGFFLAYVLAYIVPILALNPCSYTGGPL